MAVVVEYQAWDSASYNWLDKTTSTSAPVQINDKLDAWVAAVNANASNTNKQITVEKDPSDSTSANFVGWVIKLASNSANSTTYVSMYSYVASAIRFRAHSTWTNDGTNGGYGTISGQASGSDYGYTTSGSAAEFIVASETANTEEFFAIGFKTLSTSIQTGSGSLLIFKDTQGEWATHLTIQGFGANGSFYLSQHSSPTRQYGVVPLTVFATSTNGFLDPLFLIPSNSSYLPAAGNAVTIATTPKSPYLLCSNSTATGFLFGRYATLPGPRTAVCLGYSPIFVSYA